MLTSEGKLWFKYCVLWGLKDANDIFAFDKASLCKVRRLIVRHPDPAYSLCGWLWLNIQEILGRVDVPDLSITRGRCWDQWRRTGSTYIHPAYTVRGNRCQNWIYPSWTKINMMSSIEIVEFSSSSIEGEVPLPTITLAIGQFLPERWRMCCSCRTGEGYRYVQWEYRCINQTSNLRSYRTGKYLRIKGMKYTLLWTWDIIEEMNRIFRVTQN